jgi:hypothetical protein
MGAVKAPVATNPLAQKSDDSETHREVTAIAGKLSSATAVCRLKKGRY